MGTIAVEHSTGVWRNGKLRDEGKCTQVVREVQDLLI